MYLSSQDTEYWCSVVTWTFQQDFSMSDLVLFDKPWKCKLRGSVLLDLKQSEPLIRTPPPLPPIGIYKVVLFPTVSTRKECNSLPWHSEGDDWNTASFKPTNLKAFPWYQEPSNVSGMLTCSSTLEVIENWCDVVVNNNKWFSLRHYNMMSLFHGSHLIASTSGA